MKNTSSFVIELCKLLLAIDFQESIEFKNVSNIPQEAEEKEVKEGMKRG